MKFEMPKMDIALFDDIHCSPTMVSNANYSANSYAETSVTTNSATGVKAVKLTIAF